MTTNTINDAQTMAGGGGAMLAGRYRVVRQLGAGGMGSVWLAEDTQLDNKPFAIKMLPAILFANKRAYRQLKDEALVAMKLTHPNIVTLRAFEENNGNPFLVMDYIEGQTLDDYLAEKGKLTEDEVIRILKPIAAALDYAHGEGVVHRDVKPANVMVRKDGHPYILDFGIAREMQETMTRVTGKLSSGTLLYMSPEQLNGDAPKKEQDVYSFAAMAYECLKGEPPFVRGAIEDQIKNRIPDPPGGAQLGASVMAGLAKKPEDRPKSCVAIVAGEGFSRLEHVENGGARFGAVMTALAIALVLGGGYFSWMKYDEGVKSRAAEAERLKARAEEAKRKAEAERVRKAVEEARRKIEEEESARIAAEEARQKAAAEAVKRKAEEEARQKEIAAKAAATEIRIEAKVQQDRIGKIFDGDGFGARKEVLSAEFARADALFDEKVRRWSDAAQGFSSYVKNAKVLIKLDGERQKAVDARSKAEKSKSNAKQADAEKYAAARWKEAVRLMDNAAAKFASLSFRDAEEQYVKANAQFNLSIAESKAEGERRAAEAKAIRARAQAAKEKAIELFKKGKWQDGLESAEKADQNDPELLCWIGMCHDIRGDQPKAREYFRRAADKGQIDAQCELGRMYEAKQDLAQAKQWYQKAASQGSKVAEEGLSRIGDTEQEEAARWAVEPVRTNRNFTREDANSLSRLRFPAALGSRVRQYYETARDYALKGSTNMPIVRSNYRAGRGLGGPVWPELERWLDWWK